MSHHPLLDVMSPKKSSPKSKPKRNDFLMDFVNDPLTDPLQGTQKKNNDQSEQVMKKMGLTKNPSRPMSKKENQEFSGWKKQAKHNKKQMGLKEEQQSLLFDPESSKLDSNEGMRYLAKNEGMIAKNKKSGPYSQIWNDLD